MKFSVIVPVYNGEETIAKCLKALINQDYPKEDYEIIIVNDGSTDNTRKIGERYPVKLVNLKRNVGRLKAREVGAENARYDLLLFTDADCIASKDWLQKMKDADYEPVIGRCMNDPARSSIDRFFYLLRKKIRPIDYSLKEPIFINEKNFDKLGKGTGNFLCSKNLFLESSRSVDRSVISEDIPLLAGIVGKKRILKHPEPLVIHLERSRLGSVMRQWHSRGIGVADFYLSKRGYFNKFLFALMISTILLTLGIYYSILIYEIMIFLITLVLFAYWFCEKIRDFFTFFPLFLLIGLSFASGIIMKKIRFFIIYGILYIVVLILLIVIY